MRFNGFEVVSVQKVLASSGKVVGSLNEPLLDLLDLTNLCFCY